MADATAQVAAMRALKWKEFTQRSTDNPDRDDKTVRHLQAWRADGYVIVRQASKDGVYLLRTPDGHGQFASLSLSEARSRAEDHRAALAKARQSTESN